MAESPVIIDASVMLAIVSRKMNENHLGSDLDDFLRDEGILEQVDAAAMKRIIALQIAQLMAEQGISKTEMAQRMKVSRAALERLLDRTNPSVSLQTLDHAARALGRHLHVSLT